MNSSIRDELVVQLAKVEDAVSSLASHLGEVGGALTAVGREDAGPELHAQWKAIVAKLADITLAADEIAAE